MKIPVPDHIAALSPYVPGKPVAEVEREFGLAGTLKMASNENPFGPSPKAIEAARGALDRVHIYPEATGFYLCQALAAHFGWDADRIILGNGSVELIEIAAKAFLTPGTSAVMSHGAFAMYKIATLVMGARAIETPMRDRTHDLRAMADAVMPDTRILFVANPNNPTGTYNTDAEVRDLMARVPENVLVVIDEAYKEFVEKPDYASAQPLLEEHPNLLLLGTFSKAYGLAGLRIGYGFGDRDVLSVLHKARSPFNTSSLAQEAAIAALGDQEFVRKVAGVNRTEMTYVCEKLTEMGVPWTPSVANFVLIDVPMPAADCCKKLLMEGVIARPMAGWGFPNSVRVTVHLREGNDRFLRALAKTLGKN
jgi:histidinol-phosphate aminotransferase